MDWWGGANIARVGNIVGNIRGAAGGDISGDIGWIIFLFSWGVGRDHLIIHP